MIQENGQGEVSKLSNDDICGIQSALGLVSLPSSPNAPKRLTGLAFDALDESDQAKYLKQAEQMDKQRQQQLQTELGTTISDSMRHGKTVLMHLMRHLKTIISAFGYDKGTAMIADMQEAKRYAD